MEKMEDFAHNFEWRFFCKRADRSKPDHLFYNHRATRIEMASKEKKTLRFKSEKKPSKQRSGHKARHEKKVVKHKRKVKKAVDPVKRRMNHKWHEDRCPRVTRPWLFVEKEEED
jgi:hypothetical protein